jgi:uncharacterized Zn finger protein
MCYSEDTIVEVISHLSIEEIQVMTEEHIFLRGLGYSRAGNVLEWSYEDTCLSAKVRGNDANSYHISLCKEEQKLIGRCDCPYENVCKHMIAVLLTVKDKQSKVKSEKDTAKEEKIFLEYLSHLSKDELITLIDRFAPKQYKREIVLKDASLEEVSPLLHKIKREINTLLNDESLLYNPGKFLDTCVEYIDELKIVVNIVPVQVFDTVLMLTKGIERAENEGYLYCESYNYYDGNDEFFDYDYYSDKVIMLLNAIDDPKQQIDAFCRYAKYCKDSDYFFILYKKLKIREKHLLIPLLDEIHTLELYNYMAALLSYEKKEHFLKEFDPDKVFETLTALYMEYGKKDEALAYVESLLENFFKKEYAEFLIETGNLSSRKIQSFIEKAIELNCHWNNEFIMKNIKTCESLETVEVLFEKRCPDQFYDYLKRQKRMEEMHKLLHRIPHRRFEFYKKYKKKYQDEAILFFKKYISEELSYTGNEHYRNIAEYLKLLRELISKSEFDAMVSKLKIEYKRRRNFVAILDDYFGNVS